MDPLVEVQKQIKDNAEDVRRFVSDLSDWQEEMKRKEAESRVSQGSTKDSPVPPIRNTSKKRDSGDASGAQLTGDSRNAKKRISSSDYAAWEKFDVVKACEDLDLQESKFSSQTEEDACITERKLRDEANVEKEKGNQFVRREKWDSAIECYSRAIKCFSRDAIFYCNRALCYLKKKDYRAAETDCTSALKLDGTYVKALHRRGLARRALDQLDEAISDLLMATEIEPNNSAIRKDLAEAERARRDVELVIDFEKKSKPIFPAKKHRPTNTVQKEDFRKKQAGAFTWPKLDDCVVVEPINIPPHRRSKRPLQRISIQEISSVSEELNQPVQPSIVEAHSSNECKTTKSVLSLDPDKTERPDLAISHADKASSTNVILSSVALKAPPPVPKNSVQFLAGWRQIKADQEMCFEYLKKINGQDLPKIFQDSLDGNTLSEILKILTTKFVPANEPVLSYLQGLTKVKRFRTLTLFLSNADKASMEILFKHSQNLEKTSTEDLATLRKEYEL